MLERIIQYSVQNKLIVLLFTAVIVGFGGYALTHIPIGAVPDITNNQIQVITTSRNLATEDVEKFLTYPVELEMANLPGVIEIRSTSKFGLSVVTIVFDDEIGTYLPRQLIAEKIKSAEERIPAGFGKPFMGPVTTGLGEIYQYTIEVDPEHRGDYSTADLRTIQDWIVKRQLSGIPGVVEVNTWGGFLKQYEVAVNPERLRAMGISLSEVFDALENNNSIAGGGYIEKYSETYFIRADGLAKSIADLEDIVVLERNGTPIFVKDVATVGYGAANRFGAITGNGEGEKVLGQVMMLKGANSKQVIDAVKDRVESISSSLPPGIKINPFLERSELIEKTTFTIAENLILGFLIVIFVVVLLLGNFRSGLVVASVIPLCLLFALSMMYIFGVDANLMSLGAIDFGIIIDGAVIIVEFIAFRITAQRSEIMGLPRHERQSLIDSITFKSATKMMNSAVFGQLIIIIVFIPILSLANVEGKMFRPMALAFTFALVGAMILCFTYVPVAAALFLKPGDEQKKTISTRLMNAIDGLYRPTIEWALQFRYLVLTLAGLLLVASIILFARMGGEFIPTLDEGDFVIQPVLKTGTSLGQTIELTTQMEKILGTFPEVEQVVSRIGAAEVPTDPMSMEESDIIIKLRPRSEWTTAKNKDELADQFKEALSVIPGIDFEFTQPIEMRFNELITGVRADLAVKIFGEDLQILQDKANEIKKAIQNVEGAADITVEKVAGLPQMTVKYDRRKIAKFGMNVEDLNQIISMGFAGKSAGTIFEGEKQFDLVVRYDEDHRQSIDNLRQASVLTPSGVSLPLKEFADIDYSTGPAKISRDNTKRRVVVGVNVRGRDLESVVKDVQAIVEREIELPTGYTLTYGGQFENLRTAKARLAIAVPVALLLIFVLLYFAFHSVKEALIIYSAIPMASVGGILLLYFRDIPFSISAGVGFIALFGIAVLNGIVLIEEFKELKARGIEDVKERVLLGTRQRLRPVLLTATAAALGFLPMALSTSAGAEVQRPLATVVVGGLVSATLLTLLVLPVLYSLFDRKEKSGQSIVPKVLGVLALLVLPFAAQAQSNSIGLDQAIDIAQKSNFGILAATTESGSAKLLEKSAFDLDKTQLYYSFDENNVAENNLPISVFGVNQTFRFPTVYRAQKKVLQANTRAMNQARVFQTWQVEKEVTHAYYEVVYWQNVELEYASLDSIYVRFAQAATRRFEAGESNALEKLTAQGKQQEINLQRLESKNQIKASYAELQQWMQSAGEFTIPLQELPQVKFAKRDTAAHPGLQLARLQQENLQAQTRLARQGFLPDLEVGAFLGRNNGPAARTYRGVQAGVAVPLWFGADQAKVRAAKALEKAAGERLEDFRMHLAGKRESLKARIRSLNETIQYYRNTGLPLAEETVTSATRAFENGEIDYLQFAQLIDNAAQIRLNYLEKLRIYNQTAIEAAYLID